MKNIPNNKKIRYKITVEQISETDSEINFCQYFTDLFNAVIAASAGRKKIEWSGDAPDDPVYLEMDDGETFYYKIDTDGTVHFDEDGSMGDEYWEGYEKDER